MCCLSYLHAFVLTAVLGLGLHSSILLTLCLSIYLSTNAVLSRTSQSMVDSTTGIAQVLKLAAKVCEASKLVVSAILSITS